MQVASGVVHPPRLRMHARGEGGRCGDGWQPGATRKDRRENQSRGTTVRRRLCLATLGCGSIPLTKEEVVWWRCDTEWCVSLDARGGTRMGPIAEPRAKRAGDKKGPGALPPLAPKTRSARLPSGSTTAPACVSLARRVGRSDGVPDGRQHGAREIAEPGARARRRVAVGRGENHDRGMVA